jgi:phage terminase large subunit
MATKATKATILSPAEFAYFQLGMTSMYDWQIEALESVGLQEFGGLPTSVVAANGSGKTSNLVAPAVLWFLRRYPRGQVIITSGSFRQIEKQLWPAMRVFSDRFPSWKFLTTEIKLPDGGFAIGFSTDQPGRAEGWHPKLGKYIDPVMIVCDEAKSIPNAIFEAFDRCTRLIQLWVSSPGAPSGEFFDSFHTNRGLFWTRVVPSRECPHIAPEKRKRDLEKYGADSPLYRSMHLAEFSEDEERLILSATKLKNGTQIKCDPYEGEKVAFFDFAAGGDENVFWLRNGNKVRMIDAWHASDTVQAVRKFIRLAKENGLQASECWGDGDGLGMAMLDQFKEEGFHINDFRGGLTADENEDFMNLISEVWIKGSRKIERGEIYFDNDLDPITSKQLTTRFLEWDDKGRLRAESKKDLAKRGVKSPDRADALLGCIMCGSHMSGALTSEKVDSSEVGRNDFSYDVVAF